MRTDKVSLEQVEQAGDPADERIAIVGLAGRFPGARDVEQFWRNLCGGVESIRRFSDDELRASGVAEELLRDPTYVKAGGELADIDLFDAELFELTPREVETTDPQHRLFLECAWEALEHAGYDAPQYDGRIGVYAGAGPSSYLLNNLLPRKDVVESVSDIALFLGNNKDFVPTRVCYKLGLKGPGINVNTACSSSLVATHVASQALLDFQCDMALAGGVGIQVPQRAGYRYTAGGIGSPDGHCRAFDSLGDGTVNGNGVGIVVLKRLSDALADGDYIHAVLLSSAVNNDGSDKIGYTAPSVSGQSECIAEALALSGVQPESIDYIEAHGTGTRLGDPIEIAALSRAFGSSQNQPRQHCAIGSVKTNLGHLDEAAGVAGLIKTVLAIRESTIPPSLHFQTPNAEIDFANSRFHVNSRLTPWPSKNRPRRAGVSSFGIGGTNAHVILEEAPRRRQPGPSRPWQLLTVSAKTDAALADVAGNLARYLEANPDTPLADVCYTLQVGRSPLPFRRAIVCRETPAAATALRRIEAGHTVAPGAADQRNVAFLFPGQGVQSVRMGRELYDTEPVFREQLDGCAEQLAPLMNLDIRQLLDSGDGSLEDAEQRLSQTALAQPALFSFQFALARLWMSWGVQPQAMLGHSLGQFVAATLAGVWTLADALHLIAARGRLLQQLPPGGMLAVGLAEAELQPELGPKLSLAAVNSPAQCVASGPLEAIAELEQQLANRGVFCRRLQTSHAFHSEMVQPAADEFEAIVGRVDLQPPQIPFLSNVSGAWITTAEATDPKYWATHMRAGVRFSAGVEELLQRKDLLMLDIGPGQTVSAIVNRHPHAEDRCAPSCPGASRSDESEAAALVSAVGQLWAAGGRVDWNKYYDSQQRQRLPLPTYPFQRQRFWIAPPASTDELDNSEAADGSHLRRPPAETSGGQPDAHEYVQDWLRVPAWRLSDSPTAPEFGDRQTWLVFADEVGLTNSLCERLRADGHLIVNVRAGDRFERRGPASYVVRPAQVEDYTALCESMLAAGLLPARILHAWNVTRADADPQAVIDRSIYSLLFLGQVFGSRPEVSELAIDVIANGLHRVDEGDSVCAEKSLLLGPLRVAPLEYPQVRCRGIDVQFDPLDSAGVRELVDPLLSELARRADDAIIALRGQRRYKPTLEPVPSDARSRATAPTRLRERGVYLITGGLGSMGLALAEYLAEKVHARLVLVGRTSPFEGLKNGQVDGQRRRKQRIEDMERRGGEVVFLQADVANRRQMQQVVEQTHSKFGTVNGVIHTAGVPDQGLMHGKTVDQAQAVLAPKVTGTRVLESVLAGEDLDFFVNCSSMASTHPVAGQVDYCAANAFLDAFAHEASKGEQRLSIDWGFWQELGLIEKSNMPAAEQEAILEQIKSQGWSRSGVAAFERVLQTDGARQVLVSPDFAAAPVAKTLSHPWFESRVVEDSGLESFVAHLSPDEHWVLDEHRIVGQPTLPGTAYLECARAAFTCREGDGPVELREVYFLSPLVVADGQAREMRTILKPNGDGYVFHVVSSTGNDRWQEHARGEVSRPARSDVDPPDAALLERRRRFAQAAPAEDDFAARVAGYAPRWQNIQQHDFQDADEGWALLKLPEEFANEVADYGVHPALLDNATGFLAQHDALAEWFPFCYERLVLHRPLPSRFYSRAIRAARQRPGVQRYDVVLLDAEGAILSQAEGFTLRRVEDDTATFEQFQTPDAPSAGKNFRVGIDSPGHLQSLRFSTAPRPAPGPNEVEIEVSAAGLNFIEVLYALGMLVKPPGLEVRFGLECAGRVARVGPGVQSFAEGDEVMAMAHAALSRYTVTGAGNVAAKPAGVSWQAAAGLPAAYATAWHALVTKAGLQRSERVLIHSAAGGVGLAAVNVAKHIGAEILVTAGSDHKRDYLRELGIRHVSDSRSLGFADAVMEQTNGEGVDVVLNSLGGEFIDRGLSVLRQYGRFIEMGKRDIFRGSALDMSHFARQLSFMAVDVGRDLPNFEALWQEVSRYLQDGVLPPLPQRSFPATELAAAMEFMAQAKHIGKVVLDVAGCAVTPTTRPVEPPTMSLAEIVGPLKDAPSSVPSADAVLGDVTPSASQPPRHQRPELPTPYVAARDETETALAQIWQQLLGIERVGMDDNFFDLHGDSLLAAQLVSRVQQVFRVALPISIVFDATTVASQAERINQLRQPNAPPETLSLAAVEHEEGEI